MGLLTADQAAAITAYAPRYRQTWIVWCPASSGGDLVANNTLHGDAPGSPDRVVDAGRRVVEGYNVSMREPGRLTSGHYAITVDNSDGVLYPTTTNNIWYNTAGYQADPIECDLEHRVYVQLLDGTWDQLDMVRYRGRVMDVTYDEDRQLATIESLSLAALALQETWQESDGFDWDIGVDVRGL